MKLNKETKGICIPRVSFETTKEQIQHIFAHIFGDKNILHIDMIYKQNYVKNYKSIKENTINEFIYYTVFIYIKTWPDKDNRFYKYIEKLLNGEMIKVVYDFPKYWKCSIIRNIQKNRMIHSDKNIGENIYKNESKKIC